MKKIIMTTTVSVLLAFGISTLSLAESTHGSSHDMDTHKIHDMSTSGTMAHDMATGHKMHVSMVGKYHFDYELTDIREKLKGMKNMPETKPTHHMMVSIKSHGDHTHIFENGKVGFFIQNPDGTIQKIMAMGMGSGFGGDVNFKEKGVYTIKVKAVAGEEKLMDAFEYEVK